MKHVWNKIGLFIVLIIFLSTGIPKTSTQDTAIIIMKNDYGLTANSGEVTNVPYVWQELNGFCYWATLSMALQSIGAQLDLAKVLAASGVGFSAGYIRYEDTWGFLSGSSYRQQSALATFADLYGFDVEFYMDPDSTDLGSPFSMIMDLYNISWIEIDGWEDAILILKNSIDDGFPAEVYVNLQNLPASDYDIIRNLGITETDPTHSILVTGYNETSQTAHIMDPAIGLFDDPASFPDDGSWSYDINFTSLNQAWLGLYGTTIIKPGSGIPEDFTSNLANYIIDRLRGDRNSYAPDSEEVFFWNFGSNAFRAMAADLTPTGFSSFMDEYDEYNLHTKSIILQDLGLQIEGSLTRQYESYRAALEVLSSVLPDLEVQDFVTEASSALVHFELFSDNSTVNTPFYTGGIKLVTKTFEYIAYQYEHVLDGDLSAAASACEEDLGEIRTHLIAIANAWDAAADALERSLRGPETFLVILLSTSVVGMVVLVIFLVRRRLSM
ncbi:MAG: C39 family peptidase [Candidatus Thorarchaeota archaeon]